MGLWGQAGIKRDVKRSGSEGEVGNGREKAKTKWQKASERRFL